MCQRFISNFSLKRDDVTGAAALPIRQMMTTSANFGLLPGANYMIPEFAVQMTRGRRGFRFNYRFLVVDSCARRLMAGRCVLRDFS